MPDGNVSIEAAFEAIPKHSLTLNEDVIGGTVAFSVDGEDEFDFTQVPVGTEVILTPRAYTDFTTQKIYKNLGEDDIEIANDGGYKITMPDSDVTINAAFKVADGMVAASDTAFLQTGKDADQTKTYINVYQSENAKALMKFDLTGIDTSRIYSAKLKVYNPVTDASAQNRSLNYTIGLVDTIAEWSGKTATYATTTVPEMTATTVLPSTLGNQNTTFKHDTWAIHDITDTILNATAGVHSLAVSSSGAAGLYFGGVKSEYVPKIVYELGELVTLTTKVDGSAVAGVTVLIDRTEYTSDSEGKIVKVLKSGEEHKYSVPAGKYEAIADTAITAGNTFEKDIDLTEASLTLGSVTISGGQSTSIVSTSEKTLTAFTAKGYATDGSTPVEDATITWSIANGESNSGTTAWAISTAGVVTVPADAAVGDTATVTATASYNGVDKTATSTITVVNVAGYRALDTTNNDLLVEVATTTESNGRQVMIAKDGRTGSYSITPAEGVEYTISYDIKLENGDKVDIRPQNGNNQGTGFIYTAADNKVNLQYQTSSSVSNTNVTIDAGKWYHVEILVTSGTYNNDTGVAGYTTGAMTWNIYEINDDNSIGTSVLNKSGISARNSAANAGKSNASARPYGNFNIASTTGTPELDNFYVYKAKAE